MKEQNEDLRKKFMEPQAEIVMIKESATLRTSGAPDPGPCMGDYYPM